VSPLTSVNKDLLSVVTVVKHVDDMKACVFNGMDKEIVSQGLDMVIGFTGICHEIVVRY
jgi:hypothetical protein